VNPVFPNCCSHYTMEPFDQTMYYHETVCSGSESSVTLDMRTIKSRERRGIWEWSNLLSFTVCFLFPPTYVISLACSEARTTWRLQNATKCSKLKFSYEKNGISNIFLCITFVAKDSRIFWCEFKLSNKLNEFTPQEEQQWDVSQYHLALVFNVTS